MLENSVQIARGRYQDEVDRVLSETAAASGNLSEYLHSTTIDDPRFQLAFAKLQVLNRGLSEAIIFTYSPDKQIRALVLVNPYDRPLSKDIPPAAIARLQHQPVVSVTSLDRIGAVTKLDYLSNSYLYEARVFDPQFRDQIQRASDVLSDYRALLKRSRTNQLRFNLACCLGH